jgi:ABC-type bacteriocin/lantibiotic exporter with double-glycine peptidase domain
MPLLSIEHQPQQNQVGCLAACAQMVLSHISIAWSQQRLNRLFEITSMGVPLSRIQRLGSQICNVLLHFGGESQVRQFIDQQLPLIAFVRTVELPYWSEDVEHAVLIVGYEYVCLS